MAAAYQFIDGRDVDGPIEGLCDAIADALTHPEWWKLLYLSFDAEGRPEVGRASVQRSNPRLPC